MCVCVWKYERVWCSCKFGNLVLSVSTQQHNAQRRFYVRQNAIKCNIQSNSCHNVHNGPSQMFSWYFLSWFPFFSRIYFDAINSLTQGTPLDAPHAPSGFPLASSLASRRISEFHFYCLIREHIFQLVLWPRPQITRLNFSDPLRSELSMEFFPRCDVSRCYNDKNVELDIGTVSNVHGFTWL